MLIYRKIFFILLALLGSTQKIYPALTSNQTDALSPILSPESLPFRVDIELASFELPGGVQSGAHAIYDHKVLFIGGRTNGLHGFDVGDDNFPPLLQNTSVYVVDLETNKVYVKSLEDKSSGLSQEEIDFLSTTAPEYCQSEKILYFVGGYGVDSATGEFSTKPILSVIDIPGLMKWVQSSNKKKSAKQYIRQISNPIFQVAGGALYQASSHDPFLLIFGINFDGFYTDRSNGVYTQQVRTFKLVDDGINLTVFAEKYLPSNPNYRRRDLNVVPLMHIQDKNYVASFVALSGVFTLERGIWTVPVFIDAIGNTFMPDPSKKSTFKQAMNNYNSARISLFSEKANQMHTLILGGLSYEICADGTCSFDPAVPFTNLVTDIVMDKHGNMTQYLMDTKYPYVPSTFSNPGNALFFGTGARVVPLNNLPLFPNTVFSLDSLKKRTLLGYIMGGIMSTLPNTIKQDDSAASPYIFKVYATPR